MSTPFVFQEAHPTEDDSSCWYCFHHNKMAIWGTALLSAMVAIGVCLCGVSCCVNAIRLSKEEEEEVNEYDVELAPMAARVDSCGNCSVCYEDEEREREEEDVDGDDEEDHAEDEE